LAMDIMSQTQATSEGSVNDIRTSLPEDLVNHVCFGLDIGGTLAKVVYYAPDNPAQTDVAMKISAFITSAQTYGQTGTRDEMSSFHIAGGTLHFIKFATRRMQAFIDVVREQGLAENLTHITATGGGSHKFEDLFREQLGIQIVKLDEMDCLTQGVHFLLETCMKQLFYFEHTNFSEELEKVYVAYQEFTPPFLLVNIGSGISIIQIDGPKQFVRVGGSSVGGSTFLALTQLLTGESTYAGALKLAEEGDSTQVDMLVRDIYGRGYESLGLAGTVVASSFGKMIHPDAKPRPSDLAKAALLMVTNNIGSIAHLHSRLAKVDKVIFAGNFLENNLISMRALGFALDFWSKGETKALFLERVGYSGAVGALINSHVVS